MPNGKSQEKSSGWIRWFVGILISVLAAGGGIVALLKYQDSLDKESQAQTQLEEENWINFAPNSISNGIQSVMIRSLDRFDLESGHATGVPDPGRPWDLLFGGGPEGQEYFRASSGVSWSDRGVTDFDKIKYREIRDAKYASPRHQRSGYPDIFHTHRSNVPRDGYVYFIKTADGNIAKVQISGYQMINNNPAVSRNLKIQYEVFPVVSDPPRPRR